MCRAEKAAWRAKMRALREAMPPEQRAAASAAIAARVQQWSIYRAARAVFVYASMGAEAETWALIEAMARAGKRVALPRTYGEGRMRALLYRPGDALEESRFGAPEPPEGSPELPPGEIDLALIPALAVARDGARIGYGGGYYDRFLPETAAHRAALIFSEQVVDRLPSGRYDVGVQSVMTEKGMIST